jgi:hypothetical protein
MELATKQIDLEGFQAKFFESRARFPAFIAAWGTGKTMVGLMRGILQSSLYKNNLGLVVRRKFTDLRDSTIKDFERYTGLSVPMSTKEIEIPGTGSVIMFRHSDELSGLQNVNLGWFMIEQAEEFESADAFDMLRGRLRRELETADSGTVVGDFSELASFLKATPTRIGMVIANANGHDWIWRRWLKSGHLHETPFDGKPTDLDYEVHEADTFQNRRNLPADFLRDIAKLERESPKKYRRYVKNSHEEVDLEGAYYEAVLAKLRSDGRICSVPHNSALPVHTVMDHGFNTAIWFMQRRGMDFAFVRCYEAQALGVEGIAGLLAEYKQKYHYQYGQHLAPADIDNNGQRTVHGDTLLEAGREWGLNFTPLPREILVNEGIKRTIEFLPACYFDADGCEIGLEALGRYRCAKNETMSTADKPVFMDHPAKDWCNHLADAMRYCSMAGPKIEYEVKGASLEAWRAKKAARGY